MKRHSTRLSPGVIFLLVLYGLICSVLWYHGYLEHIAYQRVDHLGPIGSKQKIDDSYFLTIETPVSEDGYFTVRCSQQIYSSVICADNIAYYVKIYYRPFDHSICYLDYIDLEDYLVFSNIE